jgi:hypothetical protein
VHAATMMGDIMVESKARTVVMDKTRRILQAHYTSIFAVKAIRNQVPEN